MVLNNSNQVTANRMGITRTTQKTLLFICRSAAAQRKHQFMQLVGKIPSLARATSSAHCPRLCGGWSCPIRANFTGMASLLPSPFQPQKTLFSQDQNYYKSWILTRHEALVCPHPLHAGEHLLMDFWLSEGRMGRQFGEHCTSPELWGAPKTGWYWGAQVELDYFAL